MDPEEAADLDAFLTSLWFFDLYHRYISISKIWTKNRTVWNDNGTMKHIYIDILWDTSSDFWKQMNP